MSKPAERYNVQYQSKKGIAKRARQQTLIKKFKHHACRCFPPMVANRTFLALHFATVSAKTGRKSNAFSVLQQRRQESTKVSSHN
eukprot:3793716-Amphidinium_carterae.1